jgi:undecaprenyl-diphosphatase
VRLVINKCAGGYSFISNHAANHFGMAFFFFISFRPVIGRWVWLALVWAPLIAFAQVYVGVHYPLDVIAGAILGSLYGISMATLFNKRFGFPTFDNQQAVF